MLPLKESCMQSRLKTECRSQNSEFRSSQFRSSKGDPSYVEVESNRNGARCGFDDCGIHASRQEFQPHRSRLHPDPAIGQSLRADRSGQFRKVIPAPTMAMTTPIFTPPTASSSTSSRPMEQPAEST